MNNKQKPQDLAVIVKGEVITSNFAEFRKFVSDQLSYINYEPATDLEFGTAEEDVKMLKTVEKSLTDAKKAAIEKMESVNNLFSQIDEMSEETRQNRLTLEKAIKSKKSEVKKAILEAAYDSIIATNKDVVQRAELEAAIKGKRNLDSIQEAADSYVDDLNARVRACREVLNEHIDEHGKSLIPDADELELGDAKHLATELALRVERAKAEAERKQREAEEADRVAAEKAEADAKEKARVEDEWDFEQAAINAAKATSVPMLRSGHNTPVISPNAGHETGAYCELVEFTNEVKSAFISVKDARCNLVEPEAKLIAEKFAQSMGKAWNQLQFDINDINKNK